jgi:hypothetical protein
VDRRAVLPVGRSWFSQYLMMLECLATVSGVFYMLLFHCQ